MFENLLDSRKYSIVIGIQVTLHSLDDMYFNYIRLKKNKNELVIDKQVTGLSDPESIPDRTELDNTPVFLNIDGKVLIHKIVKNHDNSENIFNQLPVKNVDDFLIQTQQSGANDLICSIIRKDLLEKVIQILALNKNYLVDISLGPFNLIDVSELLWLDKLNLVANEKGIHFDKTNLLAFQQFEGLKDKQINLNNEQLYLILLPVYSLIASFYLNIKRNSLYYGIDIIKQKLNYKEFVKGKKTLTIFSIFILFILIINFLINTNISKSVEKNQVEIEKIINQNQLMENIQDKVKNMEEVLVSINTKSNGKLALCLDQMMLLLPDDIELNDLSVNPLKKIKNNSEEIVFENNQIIINGVTDNSLSLNEWISKLQKEEWIGSVSILEYKQIDKYKPGSFQIDIKLNLQ